MNPTIHLLLFLSISSILLLPTTSHCVPRVSTHPIHHLSHPPPSPISVHPPPSSTPPPSPISVPSPPSSSSSSNPSPSIIPPFPKIPLPQFPKIPFPPISLIAAIKDICSHTDSPDVCLSSIRSFIPVFGGHIDASGVLTLQIKACSSQTQIALSVASKISVNPNIDPMVSSSLQVCVENYNDALDNLEQAKKALVAGDIGTLNSMLSAAMTDFSTCEDGFAELPGASPMAGNDDLLSKLASNCLAIADLIK